MSFVKKHELIITVLSVLVLVGAAASYYFYMQYRNTQTILKNPNLATQKETKALIEQVSKLIELPKETPTIATITDISKLKDQAFFSHGRNGDKVFIYTGVKKAILYDPDKNIIVEVAPISIGDQNQQTQQGTSTAPTQIPTATAVPVKPTVAPNPSPTGQVQTSVTPSL